jgi:hypothetical protein
MTKPSTNLFAELPLPDGARPRVAWAQLYGSALSLAAAEAARRHTGPICIVAPNVAAADRVEQEMAFFAV